MSRRLYSWLDIDFLTQRQRAVGKWPDWLLGASTYVDGLVLRVKPKTSNEDVRTILAEWFGPRYEAGVGLRIEARSDAFPVQVEESSGADQLLLPLSIQPTFRRMSLFSNAPAQIDWPKPLPDGSPAIVSFYSFKGGVGRTTHLLAYALGLAQRQEPLKTLIIDADLEAPGLTTLARNDKGASPAEFSFVDLLALAHGDADEQWRNAASLAARLIRPQVISLPVGSPVSESFFLPAFGDPSQALSLDLRPEHLIASQRATWKLGDLFARVGRELDVDVVLIDLRAGISELASPMLFDPRMRRFIVTTPSRQSSDGTLLVLGEVAKLVPPADREDLFDPTVVLTFVTPELEQSALLQDLNAAFFARFSESKTGVDLPSIDVEQTRFAQELLYLNSLSDAFAKLGGTNVAKVMASVSAEVVRAPATAGPPVELDLARIRVRLAELAEDLEYAESGRGDRFLRTAPIRNLGKQVGPPPPVAVVVGQKGAGKTYIYLQIIRSKSWSEFAKRATGDDSPARWGLLWPVLQSKNLKEFARSAVDDCKRSTATALGLGSDFNSLAVEDAVRESLRHTEADETWWRHRWFKIIAESLSIKVPVENAAASMLIDLLRKSQQSLVLVIDGLEDLFPSIQASQSQQVALRALLQGIPAYLRDVPNCPLGIVIFVRADLAQAAIPQNFGQFHRLYDAFALRWSEAEALRLAVWIANEAGASLSRPGGPVAELMTAEEAKAALVGVWGRKLGRDNSREARSAEWVIAALSDFRGQIQARDLVRFFRHAATLSRDLTPVDRVLAPRAIRDAIEPCSTEKIDEITQEIPQLKAIFGTLLQATDRRIPFDAATSGLAVGDIRFLENVGVLIEDRGEYFMPEIFRLGLGFQLAQGARPRVLSLARRVIR